MRLRAAAFAILAVTSCRMVIAQDLETPRPDKQEVCDRPLVTTLAVAPVFPKLAWVAILHGDLAVEVTVDDSGVVNSAKILSSTRPKFGFDEPSLAAARRWRFDPQEGCSTRRAELLFRFREPVPEGEPAGVEFRPPFQIDVVVTGPKVDFEH